MSDSHRSERSPLDFIGQVCREAREEAGVPAEQIASRLGVPVDVVHAFEAGELVLVAQAQLDRIEAMIDGLSAQIAAAIDNTKTIQVVREPAPEPPQRTIRVVREDDEAS